MNNIVERKNPFEMDTFFDEFFQGERKFHEFNIMRSDVVEHENTYLINVEVPGISKEDIKMSLDDGYLNIEASMNNKSEHKGSKVIHKERYFGNFKRSFYVGKNIKESDVLAKLNEGMLNITIPKISETKEKKFISIE